MSTSSLKPGFDGHRQWEKALYADKELFDMANEAVQYRGGRDIRQIAERIAAWGNNGRNCSVPDGVIAGQIGCRRQLIAQFRETLIDLGWFRLVRTYNKTKVVDISLPIDRPRPGDPWASD